MTTGYYKGCNGVIIMYDVTEENSFSNVNNWLAEIDKHCDQNVIKLLVGNKVDLVEKRKITKETG